MRTLELLPYDLMIVGDYTLAGSRLKTELMGNEQFPISLIEFLAPAKLRKTLLEKITQGSVDRVKAIIDTKAQEMIELILAKKYEEVHEKFGNLQAQIITEDEYKEIVLIVDQFIQEFAEYLTPEQIEVEKIVRTVHHFKQHCQAVTDWVNMYFIKLMNDAKRELASGTKPDEQSPIVAVAIEDTSKQAGPGSIGYL